MRTSWRHLFDEGGFNFDGVLAPLQEVLGPDEQSLPDLRARQPALARALLQLQLPAWLVSELISDHNDLIYRRAIDQALLSMQEQGWGAPPVGFCVLVMGSGGRHESLLHPDQDNALIVEDYPPERHTEIDSWFLNFAERFTATLDEAGIPFCRGEVMASRPLWRKPISEWCHQMHLWMGQRRVKLVQMSNILLDYSPVYGDEALAERLRVFIQQQIPEAGLFLHEMAELFDEAPVALDRFDRLQGDGRDAPHPNAINLKRQGLLPLTAALRLLALKKGCPEVASRARIEWMCRHQVLTQDLCWRLKRAFEHLMDLLLRSQLTTLSAGGTADNWLDLSTLCDAELRGLQWDLQQVKAFQHHVRHGK
ncbi:DUF294 nucleotidyltransferase-like domain-containing protein [Marinobacterium sediminicola]|uniref:CBS domain-containing protein n=1 Tax=Marinobacterium sediminicola TaxID=518898 RepID=A0ABY1RWE0_9GAMM|nr:DUF294 nucleotidyltransferase-like domain-containing protein [Marinobacterium sediminicola]ULG70380.1 DUF294 nucleotidyltransferase-like domain-containing protein [Marinobacterium sediminicola]SMR69543.1 CBS domain-containing protein [Marinobacterium sediminicola]